ncbi:hypothetical protein JKP88DRAFT_25051 [Tribonema minus]|uniref:Uncharacterized protein n=1 Tax=Tribonema minus TaxID=303371 RepID=A0A835ZCH3_9STRA|nr:hypothetical protein JKP88DRAFT_25051 [Tribonema minus]
MRHAVGGDIELAKALDNARRNLEEGKSPGAGLATAEEQADAAYADLILTSVDQKHLSLGDEDLAELTKAGMMDSKSTSRRSRGWAGDIADVFNALKGGAHIQRQKDGRI